MNAEKIEVGDSVCYKCKPDDVTRKVCKVMKTVHGDKEERLIFFRYHDGGQVYVRSEAIMQVNKKKEENMDIEARIRMYEEQLMELNALKRNRQSYGDDVYEDGNVFMFEKRFTGSSDTVYNYFVIKQNGVFRCTGLTNSVTRTWENLVEFIMKDAYEKPVLYRVTHMEEVSE